MKKHEITGTALFLVGVLVGVILTSILFFCSTAYFKIGGASIFRSFRYTPQITTTITQTKTLSGSSINPTGPVSDPDPLPW